MKTITTNIGDIVLREYRGYVIQTYNLSQLGDTAIKGRAYSVWKSYADYKAGVDAISAHENLYKLYEAKQFIDHHYATSYKGKNVEDCSTLTAYRDACNAAHAAFAYVS